MRAIVDRVTTILDTNGYEYPLRNREKLPKFDGYVEVELPSNETKTSIIHTFELFVDKRSQHMFAQVIVLSEDELNDIINRLMAIEDCLNWNTFDFDYDERLDKIEIGPNAIKQIIERLNQLENASSWLTFRNQSLVANDEDSYQGILDRLSALERTITWGTLL